MKLSWFLYDPKTKVITGTVHMNSDKHASYIGHKDKFSAEDLNLIGYTYDPKTKRVYPPKKKWFGRK